MHPQVNFSLIPKPVQEMIQRAKNDLRSGQYEPPRDAEGKIIIERTSNPHLDLPQYDTSGRGPEE